MPKITIYQKPTCTTCRQVYNALKESGVDFEAVDYQLCRYNTRLAIANERLKRNRAGQVVLQLKSPYKDGTTHIVMEPLRGCCRTLVTSWTNSPPCRIARCSVSPASPLSQQRPDSHTGYCRMSKGSRSVSQNAGRRTSENDKGYHVNVLQDLFTSILVTHYETAQKNIQGG